MISLVTMLIFYEESLNIIVYIYNLMVEIGTGHFLYEAEKSVLQRMFCSKDSKTPEIPLRIPGVSTDLRIFLCQFER